MKNASCVFIHEDSERFTLQFELQNDRGVTLVYWKNGDKPEVGIWTGRGEHDYGDEPLEGEYGFREWAEIATGARPGITNSASPQTTGGRKDEASMLDILARSDAGLPLTPAEQEAMNNRFISAMKQGNETPDETAQRTIMRPLTSKVGKFEPRSSDTKPDGEPPGAA